MTTENPPIVIAILYPGCIFFELALALELLAEKFRIIFATPDGQPHQASNGAVIQADTSYENVNLENCHAVLIPGGDPRSLRDNTTVDRVIRNANKKGLWLAAICAGPSILAKAGVLKGKKIAHGYNAKQLEFLKSYFEGTELTNESFVCDDNVITAKPDAHIDFAIELACRLSAADASTANRMKDYYRGILGRKIRPLALAMIRNQNGQFLFHKAYDRVKAEIFYRPLGGGIEFSETGKVALEREIKEELNQDVHVSTLVASFENIFSFEGHRGHEIIMLFVASFLDKTAYDQAELDIFESGTPIAKAVWRSLEDIEAEGAKLYPLGLEQTLRTWTT